MGRTKASIAVAGAVIVLVGVVAAVAMGTGGSDHGTRQSGLAAATAPGSGASYVSPTVPPITAPSKVQGAASTARTPSTTASAPGTPTPVGARPSAQDIQKLIADLTAQMQAPSTTGGTAPLTQAQVEAQVREQLRLLGIDY